MLNSFRLPLNEDHSAVFVQAVRYAFLGLVITILFSASYWAVTEVAGVDPALSLTLVFLAFTAVSYAAHGAFSFHGHGQRDRQGVRASRFLVVNLIGFALNQLFVWLLVKQLHGPSWWPILPFIFITPWMTFFLHRKWVFG